jgi:hypothetical protein
MNTNLKKTSLPNIQINEYIKKFRDAEQLWFWFLSCRKKDYATASFSRINQNHDFSHNPYPCVAMDVETLITRLYLSGRLNDAQLQALKEFGDRKRAPSQHIWAENTKAALWSAAMREIQSAATIKGWVES